MNPENYNNNGNNENNISGKINLNQNSNFNSVYNQGYLQEAARPNFTKAELNSAVLPDKIAKEIRHEKLRIFFINFFSILLLATSIFFVLAYFIPKVEVVNGQDTKWTIPTDYIPHPAFMFIVMAIGLLMFILSTIQYAHVITSVNKYKGDILMNKNSVPYFLIKDYKALISRTVYVNWLSISAYVIGGILIGIFAGFMAIDENKFPFNTELIVLYILLPIIFVAHIVTLITIKYRKGNLNSYFGYEIVPGEEARAIAKRANKICLVTFIVIITIILIFVVVPYLIIRRKKGLPLWPLK